MRLLIIATPCVLGLLIGGCEPSLNWREMPVAATSLVATFPCKPKQNTGMVSMGGGQVALFMNSCESSGATFAVGHVHLADPALVGPVLRQWREATLRGVHVQAPSMAAFAMAHASALPESVRLRAEGTAPGGHPVVLQGAWFARGTEVFAAMVYAEKLSPDAVEPFFAGLKFR